MEVIRLIETEESIESLNSFNNGNLKEKPEILYYRVSFSFRLPLLRDFYIDPTDGFIIARLDNGLYCFEYDEEIITKFKFELNGS